MVKEIEVKSALHKLKRKIPYGWDLNIYHGCAHGCRYCYALNTKSLIHSEANWSFSEDVYAKTNIVDLLERELSRPGWNREVINIGGVTDSYQPAEKECALMPEILKLLIKYKTPAIISTKSDLILRDFDLIDELSRLTYVNIATTIVMAEEDTRKLIEPGSVPVSRRFSFLEVFKDTRASRGLHMMPILPYLTDSKENFEEIFSAAAKCQVDYLLPGVLYLRGKSRIAYFHFLKVNYPELVNPYKVLYEKGSASRDYKQKLYQLINPLRESYGLSSSYMKPMRDRLPQREEQISMEEVLTFD